jgi:hypothetical protein
MKSSNDIYHGDEHLTDKPQKYKVRMSEVVSYEVEVEAFDEDEACDLAYQELNDDISGNCIVDQTGFQTDSIQKVTEPQNYNYSYGGSE